MTDLAYWLALHRAPGIGPATFKGLLVQFGSPRAVFECKQEQLAGLVGKATLVYLRNPDWGAVEKDMAWLGGPGHHLLTLDDPAYPQLLREIADPPPLLFVIGNPAALSSMQLAMVGSRNPTPAGKETARDFARCLTGMGLTITSGLAVGIDAAGHRGALEGSGLTVAVAGTGLDRVYPARHYELAHRIAERGALVSEFMLGMPPLRENFPRRNRVISGLSLGTLVVEAALLSGSLITARAAAEQGREVFAIPGSIHNPLARGCHALIRQGAKLVETAADIIEELAPLAAVAPPEAIPEVHDGNPENLGTEADKVIASLGFDPVSVDTLIERSGLSSQTVTSILLVLELQGYVSSASDGLYTRANKVSRDETRRAGCVDLPV